MTRIIFGLPAMVTAPCSDVPCPDPAMSFEHVIRTRPFSFSEQHYLGVQSM
jgi:hypothetical protein